MVPQALPAAALRSQRPNMASFLDLVHDCNGVPFPLAKFVAEKNSTLPLAASSSSTRSPRYGFLCVAGAPVGVLLPAVAEALLEASGKGGPIRLEDDPPNAMPIVGGSTKDHVSCCFLHFDTPIQSDGSTSDGFLNGDKVERLAHQGKGTAEEPDARARTTWLANVVERWRTEARFEALKGWRDELYPVYGTQGQVVFTVERAASGLLGYTLPDGIAHPSPDLRVWIGRRSPTKATFPGLLDNTAAGGLTYGQTPRECMLREAQEEASIPLPILEEGLQAAGMVSYAQLQTNLPELGGCVGPETQYVFDLHLPEHFRPTLNDGEVAEFRLMSVEEVIGAMRRREFKPNCAVVMIDFFIRHGYITPENEPNYLSIVEGIRRPLGLELPGPTL